MTRNAIVYTLLFFVTGALVIVAVVYSDNPPIGTEPSERTVANDSKTAESGAPEEKQDDQPHWTETPPTDSPATGDAAQDGESEADAAARRLREHRERVERLRDAARQGLPDEAPETAEEHADHDDHDHQDDGGSATGQVTYLTFDPAVLDLGEMMKGEIRHTSVKITNASEEMVTLTRAIPTCVCTVPSMRVTNLRPGESMDVALEFEAKREGKNEVQIRFMMADDKGSQYLRVVADVTPVVAIDPESFELQFSEDFLATIKTSDRQPFRVLSSVPPVVVGIEQSPALEHTVVVSAELWANLSRKPSFIRIYTDHPKAPSLIMRVARSQQLANVSRLFNWAGGYGELEELEHLVQEGVSVDVADARGMTALMHAASNAEAERAGMIIREGAHPDVARNDGRTALMFAAASGSAETVATLIELGADVNQADRFGRTALMWAARSGDAERITMLLAAGAKVDVVGPSDETPLMYAVKARDPERVRLLIEAGAKRDAKDTRGRTALDQAVELRKNLGDIDQAAMNTIVEMLEGTST